MNHKLYSKRWHKITVRGLRRPKVGSRNLWTAPYSKDVNQRLSVYEIMCCLISQSTGDLSKYFILCTCHSVWNPDSLIDKTIVNRQSAIDSHSSHGMGENKHSVDILDELRLSEQCLTTIEEEDKNGSDPLPTVENLLIVAHSLLYSIGSGSYFCLITTPLFSFNHLFRNCQNPLNKFGLRVFCI